MATYNLGQVAIVSKGAWSASTTYKPLNTVTHNGGSFMAIAENSNKEPGVASGWANYWIAMAKGLKSISVTVSGSTATISASYTDGTTATVGTFSTTAVGDNTITAAKIVNGNVTAVKLGSDILPANVGIKMGTAVPTVGTGANQITNGQIYLKYT